MTRKRMTNYFSCFCKDIQDMDLVNALRSLMALFVEHVKKLQSADISSLMKVKWPNG